MQPINPDAAASPAPAAPPRPVRVFRDNDVVLEIPAGELAYLYGRAPGAVRSRVKRIAELRALGLVSPREYRRFFAWLEGGAVATPIRRRRRPPRRR